MLSRADIVAGLRNLGLGPGDKVLVHSSLVALGRVDGGADAVIEALLEAVGPHGLVVVPTFACSSPFDRKTSSTPLGKIADNFWRRPDAVRSLSPTHSVAAIGKGAEELIEDHEKAPTAYAEGTPYYKLAMEGGKILLLGVDQDRNTTLHGAEAIAGATYLVDVEATYIDDDGNPVTIPIAAMAGPHRDFIGLDSLFREKGIMTVGRIGKAVCRLMDGRGMLETAVEALREDPAAVLCDNPACADCVMQRGKIKAARLEGEDFILAAVPSDISTVPAEIIAALQGEGISAVELTADEYNTIGRDLIDAGMKMVAIRGGIDDRAGATLAAELQVPFIAPAMGREDMDAAAALSAVGAEILVENVGAPSTVYASVYAEKPDMPKLAFNPGRFAAAGEKPFLQVFYRGTLRRQTAHFYISDRTFKSTWVLPGRGNGEVKEIISMLRCRGYDGVMTIRSMSVGVCSFRRTAGAFWHLLDTM